MLFRSNKFVENELETLAFANLMIARWILIIKKERQTKFSREKRPRVLSEEFDS